MPQAIPALIAIGQAALAYGTKYFVAAAISAWFVTAATIYSYNEQRRQARRARDAYNASLQNRAIMVRSTEAPVTFLYGEARISGPLIYANSSGANKENLLIAVALGPGHQITAIDSIYLNDQPIGALDGNGYVTVAPFAVPQFAGRVEPFTSTQSANQVVVLPETPVGGSVSCYMNQDTGTGLSGPTDNITVVSVVGSTVTIDTSAYPTYLTGAISYTVSAPATAYVQVEKHLGLPTETAGTLIPAQDANWTSAHRGDERPWLAIKLIYNEDIFPTGLPNVSAVCRGKALYDPRTSTTYYSTNPALALRDYLLHPLGFNCTSAEIDDALVIAAANICDEVITTRWFNPATGNWELKVDGVRFTVNGPLSTAADPADNMQILCDAMAGFAVYSQGKWRIFAGAYRAPILTLNEADLVGDSIQVKRFSERKSIFNAVKGQYIDPLQSYQLVNYPAYKATSYIAEDGETIFSDFDYPLCNDSQLAQRLGKLRLGLARLSLTVSATWSYKAYKLQAGDSVTLNLPRYGLTARVMRVVRRAFSLTEGIQLILVEDDASAYSWVYTDAAQPPISEPTDLPDPRSVTALTGLTLTSGSATALQLGDGIVVPRLKATWNASAEAVVRSGGYIELEWRSAAATTWITEAPISGDSTSYLINGVAVDGHYYVRIRAVSGVGTASAWAVAGPHQVVGRSVAPPAPSSLVVTTEGNLRKYTISMTNPPADLAGFEVRYQSGATITWASASFLARAYHVVGQSTDIWLLNLSIPLAGDVYSFEVRTIAGGLYSTTGAQALNQTLTALKVVTSYLTNEAVTLAADAAGNVSDYGPASTTMKVLEDGVDVSNTWTYSRTSGPGVTSSIGSSSGILTVSAMSVDTSYVDVVATKTGYTTITRRFSLAKARRGATGTPGTDGVDGVNGDDGIFREFVWKRALTQPATPTGNGIPSGWSDDPPTGTDPLWMSVAKQELDGTLIVGESWSTPIRHDGPPGDDGAPGAPGAPGTRGSQWFYISGQTSWSDVVANNYITGLGLTKVERDVVTEYGTNFAQTRYWSGSAWIQVAVAIDGNLVVTGSLSVAKLSAGTLLNQLNVAYGNSPWNNYAIISTGGKQNPTDGVAGVAMGKDNAGNSYFEVQAGSGSTAARLTMTSWGANEITWGNGKFAIDASGNIKAANIGSQSAASNSGITIYNGSATSSASGNGTTISVSANANSQSRMATYTAGGYLSVTVSWPASGRCIFELTTRVMGSGGATSWYNLGNYSFENTAGAVSRTYRLYFQIAAVGILDAAAQTLGPRFELLVFQEDNSTGLSCITQVLAYYNHGYGLVLA